MKVLVIEGSRANGSTDQISNQLIQGVKENNHEVEKLYLFNKNIKGCLGCQTCINNRGICVWKDDDVEINQKILEADIIVFTSPVYFYSITAQLKSVFDRTYAIINQIKNKKTVFITSSAAPYVEPYSKFLDIVTNTYLGYVECFHGEMEDKGILAAWGMAMCEDVTEHEVYKQAYELGKSI